MIVDLLWAPMHGTTALRLSLERASMSDRCPGQSSLLQPQPMRDAERFVGAKCHAGQLPFHR